MSSLAWKINRIKAMSLGEILFRAWRMLEVKQEKRRVRSGWKPLPQVSVVTAEPLFMQTAEQLLHVWRECFGEFKGAPYEQALSRTNLFAHFDIDTSASINWHLDPESGITSPLLFGKDIDYRDNELVGNCKTLWELSRHKHLVPLAVAYAMTGESQYVDKITDHVDSWISQNPFALGVNWCSALEVALRLIAWSFTHHLIMLRHPEGLFAVVRDKDGFSQSIYQHVYFIRHYLSRHSSANNHLIGELTGLWVGCKCFDIGEEGRRWAEYAKQELVREAAKQVFDDGVSREQAAYYHLWVNEYLLLAWLVGRRYRDAFDADFGQRISKMSQFLSDLRPVGGQVPQIGDSDDGLVLGFDPENRADPYDELLSAVNCIGAPDRNKTTQKAFWYGALYESSGDDSQRLMPLQTMSTDSTVYPDGGYVIFGDQAMRGIFDAGSLGYPSIAAHGHADSLSLCLAFEGDWWIVDPGTYCYHTEPEWRDYFRGTGAHNTVILNDTDQSLIGGAFLWLKHSRTHFDHVSSGDPGEVVFAGRVTGYASRGTTHRRVVRFHKQQSRLRIEDFVESNTNDSFEVRFHFHPDVEITRITESVYQATHAKHSRRLRLDVARELSWRVVMGQTSPHLGWYSETLGVKVPCAVLVGHGECSKTRASTVEIDWSDVSTFNN